MSYRFKLHEPLADGVVRIGDEQIKLAAKQLEAGRDLHKGVHQARKALKRIRALLRLVRPVLRRKHFERVDGRFRHIARQLAGVRDVQAKLECIALLEARFGAMGHNTAIGRARPALLERRESLERETNGHAYDWANHALITSRQHFQDLQIEGDGYAAIGPGLAACYRRGRRGMGRAFAGQQPSQFHDWRKSVQHHWRHLQLLCAAWPEEVGARIALTRDLSEILGQDHDIAMLVQHLSGSRGRYGGASVLRDVKALCGQRQMELRALARPRGDRLFAEPARDFAGRMESYWRSARYWVPAEHPGVASSAEPPSEQPSEPPSQRHGPAIRNGRNRIH